MTSPLTSDYAHLNTILCQHCHRAGAEHVQGKCLFGSTSFARSKCSGCLLYWTEQYVTRNAAGRVTSHRCTDARTGYAIYDTLRTR